MLLSLKYSNDPLPILGSFALNKLHLAPFLPGEGTVSMWDGGLARSPSYLSSRAVLWRARWPGDSNNAGCVGNLG